MVSALGVSLRLVLQGRSVGLGQLLSEVMSRISWKMRLTTVDAKRYRNHRNHFPTREDEKLELRLLWISRSSRRNIWLRSYWSLHSIHRFMEMVLLLFVGQLSLDETTIFFADIFIELV